ncbi:MAG: LuxR family transcriptional regulator [Ilumatobacteraceae bacterium]|nr:LuxR family transcriptional regulator [Ilumatobacteraceae bacterium]
MELTVALLNDYRIVVDGLAKMLEPFDDIAVVELEVGNVDVQHDVDIALFDTYGRVGMPWQQLEDLVARPNVRNTTVFTFDFGAVLVERALSIGVHGYLWKGLTPAALAESLRRVAGGDVVVSTPENQARQPDRSYRWPFDDLGLSSRESEVLALLAEGLSNQQIADGLYLNVETVRSHLKQIYSKLGVHTRTQATAKALRGQAFLHR